MFHTYLVTGASGFLGRAVLAELKKKGVPIRALVMENDPLASGLPEGVSVFYGDVCDDASLARFFSGADSGACVIHCAGIVSVASHPGERIYRVNVGGTNNILRHCERARVGKLVYVSSVHAIPEKPKGTEITEDAVFSPELVRGDYAKSKAIATSLVFETAGRGLNASVVFPSGIIGPGDVGRGSITNMLLSFLAGKLPVAVKGGYDFVDVRDVAAGILACCERGRPGECYILSGRYCTVRDVLAMLHRITGCRRVRVMLPLWLARAAAPLSEQYYRLLRQPPLYTAYSLYTLSSGARFSHAKAARELGYTTRPFGTTLADTVAWLRRQGRI